MEKDTELSSILITHDKIKEKIKNLKNHSAAGPDGIGPEILKGSMHELQKRTEERSRKLPPSFSHQCTLPHAGGYN